MSKSPENPQYQTNASNLKKSMHISGNFENPLSKSREKCSTVPKKRKQPEEIGAYPSGNLRALSKSREKCSSVPNKRKQPVERRHMPSAHAHIREFRERLVQIAGKMLFSTKQTQTTCIEKTYAISPYPRISRAPCPNRGKNALQYQTNANNLKKLMHISGNFESALSKPREKCSSVPDKRKQPEEVDAYIREFRERLVQIAGKKLFSTKQTQTTCCNQNQR